MAQITGALECDRCGYRDIEEEFCYVNGEDLCAECTQNACESCGEDLGEIGGYLCRDCLEEQALQRDAYYDRL